MSPPSLTGSTQFLDHVSTTALRLYQAESLDEILQNTVRDVKRLLEVDRVVIYQLDSEGKAQTVATAANSTLPPLPDHCINLSQCLQRWLEEAILQHPKAINHVAKANLSDCERLLLLNLGIEATILTPIFLSPDWQKTSHWQENPTANHDVWGFLVAHQSYPRRWKPLEQSFLRQLTQHLFHAIHQVQLRQFSERLIESAVDGIIALDTNYRYQVWNSPMEKLSGLSREDVIGQVAWDVLPFLKETGEDKLITMAMAGQPVVAQNRAFTLPETEHQGFFEARYSPLTDPSGKVLGCLGLIRDISEQKQAEYQLRATTSRLTTLIQSLQSGVLVEDENRRILLANQTFCQIFRLPTSPEDLRGPNCEQLLLQAATLFKDPQEVIQGIQTILEARDPVVGEEIQLSDGRTLERDYIPIFIDNEYQGHLWQYRDITQRKQVLQQLEDATQSAKAANQAKSSFLATMSHEIRTPLNAIIGLTELLRMTRLDTEQQDFADTIYNSGTMLLSLINDILDFSKIEAGKLEIEHRDFNLHHCVQDVVSLMTPLAEEKGLAVRSQIATNTPEWVVGDVTRLRQVLLNLVNNGVKFTHRGSVTVDVTLRQGPTPTAPKAELYFEVKDTGIGIPDDSADALFEAFSQLDASVARRYGGSGLGLAICKNLVEAMDGTIGFTTQPGGGTTFYFTIQVPLTPNQGVNATENPELDHQNPDQVCAQAGVYPMLAPHLPLRILVVDDLSVNQKVATKMLQRLGYQPDYASDGITAINLIQQQPYDLVLMDIQMPGMDGYQTTELVRQLPQVTSKTPWIVAMTAHSNLEAQQLCLQTGMNDFLSKPIVLASLTDCLMRYGQAHYPDIMAQFSLPNRSILIMDHSPQAPPLLNLEMINDIRQMAGAAAKTLLAELVNNYQEDATYSLQQLHQAVYQQDLDQIRQQAHALRSMSLNLGTLALGTLCQDLELNHSQMTPADHWVALNQIEQAFVEATAALQAAIDPQSFANP